MSSGRPVELNCPAWCVTKHAEHGEVRHYSEISAVPMSLYPFMAAGELCNIASLATLDQMPYDDEPLVTVVGHDDPTETKLTVDEAEQFAKALLELVDVARSYDGRKDDAARSAFLAGHCAGLTDGQRGLQCRASEHWESYSQWKAERDAEEQR